MTPESGRYKVTHIYRDGPADKEWIDINVGDFVLAIDGQEIKAGDNYWKIFNNLLNEYVNITVSANPNADNDTRTVRIKTVLNLRDVSYEEWIAKNREFVDKESNGQIVYVHIRSMNQPSLRKFEQEIDQFFYKKGIIIDVRFNGGGNIDRELMDILERKPYQYTWTKTGSPVWGRRPKQTIVGPKVMLTNWRSGSDAEMTPHGFRHLGLGRLLGTPTNGAVVSARRYSLLDGGSTRIPRTRVVSFDPTKPHNFGFNLENYGVPPDVWVRNSPEDEISGFDRVLKTAVDEVLGMLKKGTWQWTPTEQEVKGGTRP
jgi:tricorn protease